MYPLVEVSSDQDQYYIRSAWHLQSGVRSLDIYSQTYPAQMYPPPGRTIWWPRMVLTSVQLISAPVLFSTIDCLEFSRVLCNSPSSYLICNPQYAPDTPTPPIGPLIPPCKVQASRDQEWYYYRSAWHIISLWVSTPTGRCIWWPRVVLTEVWFPWTHVLLSSIYYLAFSRLLWNTLS